MRKPVGIDVGFSEKVKNRRRGRTQRDAKSELSA